jgi:ADP-ribosyl-[dinitrogen reductase] hydrolase
MDDWLEHVQGVILGTAVGDALGLPFEMIPPRRLRRLLGTSPLGHRFLWNRGMTSDDTEHTCILAQSLLREPTDPERFARSLAWGLRFWFLSIPVSLGWATLRSVLRLWVGFPPHRSGVFSAGNGPAMRSALLGLCFGHDPARLRAFVSASTRLTHTDPRAERGALLIALAAHHGASGNTVDACALLEEAREEADEELLGWLTDIEEHLARNASASELAQRRGLTRGVTGYIYHSVPFALYCWLRARGDFRQAVEEVILLGGDTDTTGAITGALCGATRGAQHIPEEWVKGLWEWPRSVRWMRELATRIAEQFPGDRATVRGRGSLPLFWPGLYPRNALFFLRVLVHAGRRLLPPY